MPFQHIHRVMEVKEVNETGSFEGLASVYGNVDLGADIVEPGAFKEFAFTKDRKIRIFDGHNTRLPVGKGEVMDSHLGLVIRGQLNLKVSRARDVHELMKDGIIDGLSVGFDILPDGQSVREDGVRLIKAAKLWEVSVTPFPMNPLTLVSSVKEKVRQITTQREFEDAMRELGFSRTKAAALSKSFKQLQDQGEPDVQDEDGDGLKPSEDFMAFLKQIKPIEETK